MLTELSRYNLGIAFSRSYRGHNWWILVAFVVCYSPLVKRLNVVFAALA